MNTREWRGFPREYNSEMLSYEPVVEALPRGVIKKGWMGYKGASESALANAEKRLGTKLPPSYRAFLKVSNGWRFPSGPFFDLWPTDKIAWFRVHHQDWIDAYNRQPLPVSDREYFVYGPKQSCLHFREEYLQAALQISDVGDSAVVLLNPKIVTPEGEWETWFFANWLPGARRYRSFAEWLAAERRYAWKEVKRLPQPQVYKYVTSKKPVSTKKAQAAARMGQTDLAVDSLERFAAKGDDSAAASLAELYAFLGAWEKVIVNAGRLIANPGAVYAGNVFDDMIRLLGQAGHRSGQWARIIEVVEVALIANTMRFSDLRRRQNTKLERDIITNAEQRNERVCRNLIAYARRRGAPPHELLKIFGIRDPTDDMSIEQRKAAYQNVIHNADRFRPDLKANPQARMEYFFSMARGLLEEEALRLYEAHGRTFCMRWQAAEYVARIYVRRGNRAAAWAAIKANLKHWWPADHAQVVPVVLLIDEGLEMLMTPERCRFVLSTPRGGEAAKAGK